MTSMPPTAVTPEMALVTLMRGECRAGVTPQTVWYPQMLASPNLVTCRSTRSVGLVAGTGSSMGARWQPGMADSQMLHDDSCASWAVGTDAAALRPSAARCAGWQPLLPLLGDSSKHADRPWAQGAHNL